MNFKAHSLNDFETPTKALYLLKEHHCQTIDEDMTDLSAEYKKIKCLPLKQGIDFFALNAAKKTSLSGEALIDHDTCIKSGLM